jgi:hypothetical protein
MAGTITVGELLSDPTSSNKITIGTGTTLDLVSGAGSVSMPSASLTGALPALDGSALTNMAAGGKVLQTKFSSSSTSVNISTGGSDTDIVSLSFTPTSSTSQMMVTVSGVFYKQGDSTGNAKFTVKRGSTPCDQEYWAQQSGTTHYLYYSGSTPKHYIRPLTYIVFDKPLSTATVTYTFQVSNGGSNTVSFYKGVKIIVTEIEA